jgi:hypothetical protein
VRYHSYKNSSSTDEYIRCYERNYDLRVQAVKDADILARIPTLEAAGSFPVFPSMSGNLGKMNWEQIARKARPTVG